MKYLSLIFFICLLACLFSSSVQAQVFFKADAPGSNDGSSWTNAYTDLQTAIDNHPGDQLWVAAGTWHPAAPGGLETENFSVTTAIQLYGGFDGTESMLTERDISANPTILSGDLNDDDIPNDFELNRSDNVQTVLIIGASVTNTTVIDGFTFTGGHSDGADLPASRGGGIFNEGLPIIRNCTFIQNFANRGAGILNYISPDNFLDTLKIDNCLFSNNTSESAGSGIFHEMLGVNQSFSLTNSIIENGIGRGATIIMREANGFVMVDNCIVDSNSEAIAGGGMLIRPEADGCNYLVTNSEFTNNFQEGIGGGLRCYFQTGSSNSAGEIYNCIFSNNTGRTQGGGIAIWFRDANNSLQIGQCHFENNALEGNEDESFGGAISLIQLNTGTNGNLNIHNCSFLANSTLVLGGAIDLYNQGEGLEVEIAASQFLTNETLEAGHAISAEGDVGLTGNLKIENCLFAEHQENNATVLFNTGSFNTLIRNNTFADNSAIALTQQSADPLEIQNNIFHNPNGINLFSSTQTNSLGGNIFTDDSASSILLPGDQQIEDPDFVGSGLHPFQLGEDSKAINTGILSGEEAEFDLAGEPRVQNDCIDAGAYESDFGPDCATVVGTKERLINNDSFSVTPNPATATVLLTLHNHWQNNIHLQLVNVVGQTVRSEQLEKTTATMNWKLDIKDLDSGAYILLLSDRKEMIRQSMLKL